jgi:hypothetical protein
MRTESLPNGPPGGDDEPPLWPGARAMATAAVVYLLAIAAATWPFALRFGRGLPASWVDPYQHLWVMRWYRTCLLEGRWPVFCPEIHQPVGAPLGLFSPLHLPSLLFVPLSLVIDNDLLLYDLVWLASLLATGLGVNLLAGWAVRDRVGALVAGLVAMLAAPVLVQAHSAVELIQLGGMALFLRGWLRFVDAPSRRGLLVAVGLYGLVALGAAYFAVYIAFPSALYVVYAAVAAWRRGDRRWLVARAWPLAAFAAMAALVAGLVFAPQLWAQAQGFPMARMRSQFAQFRAPGYAYLVPTPHHLLGRFWPASLTGEGDPFGPIGWSYLGVVTLALAAVAAIARVRFPRAGFWWLALGLVVVLSAGDSWTVAGRAVPLPAGWLRDHTPLFAPIRVPARFNLLAAALAAVPAAAGLSWIGRRDFFRRRPAARAVLVGALVVLATADGAMVPFEEEPRPPVPGAYAFLQRRDPRASWVEVPQVNTEGANGLAAATLYWQSLHRGRTTAGYSGQGNLKADSLLVSPSPFAEVHLRNPSYLVDRDAYTYDLTPGVRFADQAWLYLHAHGLRYVVVHQGAGVAAGAVHHLAGLKAALATARVYEDAISAVYDASRLAPPSRPTALCTSGWGPHRNALGRDTRSVGRAAAVAVYTPNPAAPVRLELDLAAFRRPRRVRLLAPDGAELARWSVVPRDFRTCVTPALRLPAGLVTLRLESDGEERPRGDGESAREGDASPYSLIGARVQVLPADGSGADAIAVRPLDRPAARPVR